MVDMPEWFNAFIEKGEIPLWPEVVGATVEKAPDGLVLVLKWTDTYSSKLPIKPEVARTLYESLSAIALGGFQ